MCQSFTNVVSYEIVACSRRSDSRAREKNSRGKPKKKRRGETRGGKGERKRSLAFASPVPPPPATPRFPGVQLNSLPTYRHALLSEPLEQAKRGYDF